LAAGAVCITSVPSLTGAPQTNTELLAVAQLIRGVARARPRSFAPAKQARRNDVDLSASRIEAVGIVASAGGPGVLAQLLVKLPASFPPVLLVQHISPGFAETFAHWLCEETGSHVELAREGAQLEKGCTYVAPDDVHLTTDGLARVRLTKEGPVGPFRPSGDALLTSLGQVMGNRALGVILTGMGRDGTAGARELVRRGGRVIAQDRHSSIVYGMPKAALESGAAEAALSLSGIAKWLVQRCLEV
jgi:two-component system chemotaxis response regulator CheB